MKGKSDPDARWKASSDAAWRRVGEEIVVLHLPSSEYFTLNETAAFVWEALVGGASALLAAERLSRAYDVEPERAARDARALLDQFLDAGLLVAR